MAVKNKPVFTREAVRNLTEMTYDDISDITIERRQPKLFPEGPVVEGLEEYDNPVVKKLNEKKKKIRLKRSILLRCALIFALGLLVVFRYASITEMGYKVAEADNALTQITAENERIKVSIDSKLNISEITTIAKSKFGMQQPQTYQMKVLAVQLLDQTEVYKDIAKEEETDDRAWYTKAYDFVREFLGVI